MLRIYAGAIMVIAGIAAFIEAHSHLPQSEELCGGQQPQVCPSGTPITTVHHGLSQTAYDLLRIGAWALVILGALTVIVGFVVSWQGLRRAA